MTIFGEEHFLDNEMCKMFSNIKTETDNMAVDKIYEVSLQIGISVDKDKLRRWLILCHNLENIDRSDLIDIAIRKKFDEKNHQIAVLENALKLACEAIDNEISDKRCMYCEYQELNDSQLRGSCDCYDDFKIDRIAGYFKKKSEKELQNGKNS